jgi:hypothetical protein
LTEQRPTSRQDRQAVVRIAAAATIAEAVRMVLPGDAIAGTVVLPSTRSRRDRLAAAVRADLRGHGVPTHLVIPEHPAAAVARADRPGNPTWRSVWIAPPDLPATRVLLPARLADAAARWIATDVTGVGGRGPYVLDLLARYLHPRDRLRLLALRRRDDAAVDLNLGVSTSLYVITQELTGCTLAAVTTDPIAAELVALSLAEENLPDHLSVQGIWEDRVIQRATELDLGVQVPAQIAVSMTGADRFPDAHGAVMRLASRIDVNFA